MQIQFTGRHIEVTPALKSYTEEKLERLNHRSQSISNVSVIFHIEKDDQSAEATLHADGTDFHASATARDMYSAIDLLVDKLIGQITKHKEKSSDRHR
jgi:putative sigma-54 modulation protein